MESAANQHRRANGSHEPNGREALKHRRPGNTSAGAITGRACYVAARLRESSSISELARRRMLLDEAAPSSASG